LKVSELKEILNSLPDDTQIVMSSDSEGNSYSPLSGYCVGQYVPENTWSGTFYDETDFKSECEEGYCEPDSAIVALCIWPTN
jgi:hypothetical protein